MVMSSTFSSLGTEDLSPYHDLSSLEAPSSDTHHTSGSRSTSVPSISTSLADLTTRVDLLQSTLEARSDKLQTSIDGGFNKLQYTLNRIDRTVGKVDEKTDRIQHGVWRTELGVGRVESSVGRVEGGVGKVKSGIGTLEGTVGRVEGGVARAEIGVWRAETSIGRVETAVDTVKATTDRVEAGVKAGVGSLGAKVDTCQAMLGYEQTMVEQTWRRVTRMDGEVGEMMGTYRAANENTGAGGVRRSGEDEFMTCRSETPPQATRDPPSDEAMAYYVAAKAPLDATCRQSAQPTSGPTNQHSFPHYKAPHVSRSEVADSIDRAMVSLACQTGFEEHRGVADAKSMVSKRLKRCCSKLGILVPPMPVDGNGLPHASKLSSLTSLEAIATVFSRSEVDAMLEFYGYPEGAAAGVQTEKAHLLLFMMLGGSLKKEQIEAYKQMYEAGRRVRM
ncbi:hypothetical protein IAT38_000887 [Cryptococcus sp. DSM 104549]